MTRKEIIEELKKYFKIKELVCPHTLERHGDKSWMFISTMALDLLLVLRRDILAVPLVCNTKSLTQRGLRCNQCDIVKGKITPYLSAHVTGNGFDLSSPDMSAEEMRLKISKCVDMLPCKVRIEQGVNWLHIDVYDELQRDRIKYFSVKK